MQAIFIQYIYLILIILALVMIANKLRLAYPIVLVLGGLLLSFTTDFSKITIDPELIFFIFLPPLLYEAAWQVSWKELWRWRRVITSFAFPIVIITSCVVAFVSKMLIPGFTLALGFLLGGIISPPDAVSASTIMRQVKVSRSMLSIVEGESLLNDASSLIVFRFALAAVITGQFHFQQAAVSFLMVVVMGTLIGLAMGFLFYGINRWLPTTSSMQIVLSLVAPYSMYYFAEHFHFSGVLSVVTGSLFLSVKRQDMLTYRGRVEAINVWSVLGFVLNGVVFLLIGLQLPSIIEQLGADMSLGKAIWYGLAISGVLIVARLICTLGASLFTRFASHFITVADNNPGWRSPIVFGWAGMRGVVSLAAALSIPLLVSQGHPFPYRNLILFITFIVILVTLVFQGLTLPWVIRTIKPEDHFTVIPEEKQELIIQKKIALSSVRFLEEKYGKDWPLNEHLDNLYERLKIDLKFFDRDLDEIDIKDNSLRHYQYIYLEMLQQQRHLLNAMNNKAEFDEELIRKYLSLVDLEEIKIREKLVEVAN